MMESKDKHIRFLTVAKRVAEKTKDMKRQFGAVVVNGNRIVRMGRNRKSHPKTPKIVSQITDRRYYGLHSEISVLLKCDLSIRGMTIYIHGQNKMSGKAVYSKPCELCEIILKRRGIRQAVYTTPLGYEVIQLGV